MFTTKNNTRFNSWISPSKMKYVKLRWMVSSSYQDFFSFYNLSKSTFQVTFRNQYVKSFHYVKFLKLRIPLQFILCAQAKQPSLGQMRHTHTHKTKRSAAGPRSRSSSWYWCVCSALLLWWQSIAGVRAATAGAAAPQFTAAPVGCELRVFCCYPWRRSSHGPGSAWQAVLIWSAAYSAAESKRRHPDTIP